jgi:hypothetical protein
VAVASRIHLTWIAAGEGDELIERSGVGDHRYRWIESGDGAALGTEGLPRQGEDVCGVGICDVDGTVQCYREISAMDEEFERQDAGRKWRGQYPPAEPNVCGQSEVPPPCQDRLRHLLYAFVEGTGACPREHYPGSGAEA